jgi:activating signal cointegrator complex subunit 3
MAAMNKPLSDAILENSDVRAHLSLIMHGANQEYPEFYMTPESQETSNLVSDPDLQNCLHSGFGLHHTALSNEDQNIIEQLFESGNLKLLIAIAALALKLIFLLILL